MNYFVDGDDMYFLDGDLIDRKACFSDTFARIDPMDKHGGLLTGEEIQAEIERKSLYPWPFQSFSRRIWVIRDNFVDAAGFLAAVSDLVMETTVVEGVTIILVRDCKQTSRGLYAKRIAEEAVLLDSLQLAKQAWLVTPHATPRISAVLCYLLEKTDSGRAKSYRDLEQRSCGDEFARQLDTEWAKLKEAK